MSDHTPPAAPPLPPYAPQQYPSTPYIAPQVPKVSGLAIAALVLGILWLYWIGSILAMIFGAVALRQINESHGWRTGKGMAIAGLVLGLVGALTFFLVVVAAASA